MDEDTGTPAGSSGDPLAEIDALARNFEDDAREVRDTPTLEELRACYIGRKRGRLTAVFDGLRDVAAANRGAVGKAANRARQTIEKRLGEIEARVVTAADEEAATDLDVTLPGRGEEPGSLHPITLALEEIVSVFTRMGYKVVVHAGEHCWNY